MCWLPRATLGKEVAECFSDFAECPWHSANLPYPIVQWLTLYKIAVKAAFRDEDIMANYLPIMLNQSTNN